MEKANKYQNITAVLTKTKPNKTSAKYQISSAEVDKIFQEIIITENPENISPKVIPNKTLTTELVAMPVVEYPLSHKYHQRMASAAKKDGVINIINDARNVPNQTSKKFTFLLFSNLHNKIVKTNAQKNV